MLSDFYLNPPHNVYIVMYKMYNYKKKIIKNVNKLINK